MQLSLSAVLLSLGLLLFTTVIIRILASDIYKWYYLPPGALPVPFLGNLILLSRFNGKEAWHIFQELSRIYGSIYTLWIRRTPNMIVSDPEIAFELLSIPSSKYSSCARSMVSGDIYDGNSSLVVLPFGPSFTFRRKMLHTVLNSSAASTFRGRQEAEASTLAYQVLTQSDSWSDATLRFSSSVCFSIAYGRRIDSLESDTVRARLAHIQ